MTSFATPVFQIAHAPTRRPYARTDAIAHSVASEAKTNARFIGLGMAAIRPRNVINFSIIYWGSSSFARAALGGRVHENKGFVGAIAPGLNALPGDSMAPPPLHKIEQPYVRVPTVNPCA